jgi:hypothetical protein
MLLLTSTSDILRVVTGSAADVDVHASWVDNASGTITPGRTNTAAIVTATTTTVVGSPAASTQRNVKHLNITNVHASVTTTVVVQHFDGTTSEDLMGVTLLPGENLVFNEGGEWRHHDSQGAEYAYNVPARGCLGPTGCLAETMPREICPEVNTVAPTASGTLFLQAIYLTAGQLVSNITISSATTAAGTPTNYFFALYSGARALLAVSANQTTTAWAANTVKTLAMTTPYRVPTSGLYYIGIMMTATTIITTKGGTAKTGGQLASTVPILHGASSTGLTTAMPDPAAAITGGLVTIYAAVT